MSGTCTSWNEICPEKKHTQLKSIVTERSFELNWNLDNKERKSHEKVKRSKLVIKHVLYARLWRQKDSGSNLSAIVSITLDKLFELS